jgi:peptidoglycan/xylan/chitin deacetylase (PgdA/CDA1 family)
MPSYVASIWRYPLSNLVSRIEWAIDSGFEKSADPASGRIFFRADDVAVPGKRFVRMMELFARYRAPLSLAVVPARLTGVRWQFLKGFEKKNPSRWCWHQHGWRHVNHETEGKKQEFGEVRTPFEIRQDLIRGQQRLTELMGKAFFPVFTPPWNRCSGDTLQLLREIGYVAVSRSHGSKPQALANLPDFFVSVDLHTRKEKEPAAGRDNLVKEFKQAAGSGECGIMIHHQMMNESAFDFLEALLKMLVKRKKLHIVHFRDMVEGKVHLGR